MWTRHRRQRLAVAAGVVTAVAATSFIGQGGAVAAAPTAAAANQTRTATPGLTAAGVSYGYDAAGRLTSVTDGAGATRTLTYDAVGNLVSTTAAVAGPATPGSPARPATAAAAAETTATQPAPVVTSATYARAGRTGRVVVTGTHLPEAAAARVKVAGLFAPVISSSPTRLVVQLPPGVAAGAQQVRVTGEGGSSSATVTLPAGAGGPVAAAVEQAAADAAQASADTDPTPLSAAPGRTALAGRVKDATTGRPLPGVVVSIDAHVARSRADGRFLVTDLVAGHHELVVDGRRTADGVDHGLYEVGVDVVAGRTTHMGWTTWLTPVDVAHAVTLPRTITREIVVTNPKVPGLEVHVPPGTVLTGADGRRVTALSITPMSLQRQPFPGAPGMPLSWTIQPGGATVSGEGLRVVYPNLAQQLPGVRIDYVNHDAARPGLGWAVYGHGRVSADGTRITPDRTTRLHETYDLGVSYNPLCQYLGIFCPRAGDDTGDGDPVDLQTGLFVSSHTDLAMPDAISAALTRTYRQNDYVLRSFGIGQTDAFNSFVSPDGTGRYLVQMPGGATVPFAPTGVPGTYAAVPGPTGLTGALMTTDNHTNFKVTLLSGQVLTFGGYTASLIATSDRYGNTTTTIRDGQGRVLRVTTPNGRWIALTWGLCTATQLCITAAKDSAGRTVRYTYDASGRLVTVTDPAGKVTTTTWSPCLDPITCTQVTAITDPLGIAYVRNSFDTAGRVATQLQPDGTSYSFSYSLAPDLHANSTTVTDPRGNQRQVTFDATGYAISDTAALGTTKAQTTTMVRDTSHRVTSTTDPLGRTSTWTYDDATGNVLTATTLSGTAQAITESYTYEPLYQRVASATNARGKTVTFAFDDAAGTITLTDPLGHTSSTTITEGRPVSVTDGNGATTYTSYLDGDPVAVVDPGGRIWRSYYDASGRLTKSTDPTGARERYRYDVLGQVTASIDPLGQVTTFGYDADGQVLTMTDPLGHVTTQTYDGLGRVATRKDALGGVKAYTYDAVGNVVQVKDRNGTKDVFTYDALDRLTFAGYKAAGQPVTYESTITNTFDAADRLTKAVDTAGGTLTRSYDGLDDVTSESTSQGSLTATYDKAGRRTALTVAGQAATTYSYDDADRPTGVTSGLGAVTVGYDAGDRRTSVALPGGVTQKLTYDPSGSLAGIDYRTAAGSLGTLSYTYDAAGRRTGVGGTFARVSLPAVTGASTYNAVNALTARGGATYTYDAEGQLTGDGTRTYAWNSRHQLTGVTGGGTTASFTYDPAGRRLTRTVGATTTGFVYDADNVVQEKQGANVSNLLTGFRTDETFARSETAGTRSLLTDALGSTVALTSSAGAVATSYTYDPYGVASSSGVASTNAMQFTGRENDGTGLDYNRARYYSPGLQRFLSQDPAGEQGSGTNLYGYVDQSPTNATDPSGKFVNLLIGCAVGAAFGVGTGWLMSSLMGNKYTLKQGLIDAGLGCAGGALMGWLRPAATVANEGIYVVRTAAGDYVGQSGNIAQRMAQHVASGKFTQAEVDAAERIAVQGGKTAREIAEQLRIDSMGGIENLLNKVNPIGQARLHLMPPGYVR